EIEADDERRARLGGVRLDRRRRLALQLQVVDEEEGDAGFEAVQHAYERRDLGRHLQADGDPAKALVFAAGQRLDAQQGGPAALDERRDARLQRGGRQGIGGATQ